ncbi:MAG: tetratricopeptide repeat protein, partial [Planctomycetes bacterium]|nr:tetratricopeptide repeat protein [Planctomycetota bacterium]
KVATRNVPESAEAKQWIARTYLKEKNPAEALKAIDTAISQHGTSPQLPQLVYTRIDILYEIPDRRPETISMYADFAEKNPQSEQAPQALYLAALTALEFDDASMARTYSGQFLTQFANDKLATDVQFIAAESRLLLKEYAEADQLYQAFLQKGESHASAPQARIRRGLILQLTGKHSDSIQLLTQLAPDIKDPTLKSELLAIVGRSHAALKQFDLSLKSFEESLSTKPDRDQTDETLLALSDVFRQLGRNDSASEKLQQVVKTYPNSRHLEEVTFRLGEAAYAGGQFEQATTYYNSVIEKWGKGQFVPHALYGLGWTAFKQNDFPKSVQVLTTLASRHPDTDAAKKGLYVRAMARYQMGDVAAAADDATKFIESKPEGGDLLDAQYLLGLVLAAGQKYEQAIKTYMAILDSNSQYANADKVAYELGWAYTELGRKQEAEQAFRRLADKYPQSPLAGESLFRVAESHYENGQFSEASKVYLESIQKVGADELGEKILHKMGWSWLKQEKLKEAVDALTTQLTRFPKGELEGDATFLIGECLFKQKDWKSAKDRYLAVSNLNNSTYQALATYRCGVCAGSLEQWDESMKLHQQTLEKFPDFEMKSEARYGIGWALQQQGKWAEAIAQYEAVTEETDTETAANARFMIGECYFAQKNHKEATKHFLKTAFAYGHKEWSAMAFFEAARCFE